MGRPSGGWVGAGVLGEGWDVLGVGGGESWGRVVLGEEEEVGE